MAAAPDDDEIVAQPQQNTRQGSLICLVRGSDQAFTSDIGCDHLESRDGATKVILDAPNVRRIELSRETCQQVRKGAGHPFETARRRGALRSVASQPA